MIDTGTPDARERLEAVLGVRRLVDEAVAGGPYDSVEALAATVDASAAGLTDAELDEATAGHPRIGETPAAGSLSASEQAGLGPAEEGLEAAIVRGNAVYEGRFNRIFLIRAAGRSQQDVLDELQRRLKNDPADEAEEAKQQLREIIGMRLRSVFGEPRVSQVTTHVLDAAFGTPAVGVAVELDRQGRDGWTEVASGATGGDGRIGALGPDRLEAGVYRLVFATGDYFQATHRPAFYPEVQVSFLVTGTEHYHVPLLLSPFAYSTYRGS